VRTALRFSDFIPQTPGGIRVKYWVRTTDRAKIYKATARIFRQLRNARFETLSTFYQHLLPRITSYSS
jgi:hypothetical protein